MVFLSKNRLKSREWHTFYFRTPSGYILIFQRLVPNKVSIDYLQKISKLSNIVVYLLIIDPFNGFLWTNKETQCFQSFNNYTIDSWVPSAWLPHTERQESLQRSIFCWQNNIFAFNVQKKYPKDGFCNVPKIVIEIGFLPGHNIIDDVSGILLKILISEIK